MRTDGLSQARLLPLAIRATHRCMWLEHDKKHTPEAHDENLEVHELRHCLQAEGADLAAVLVHESGIVLQLQDTKKNKQP